MRRLAASFALLFMAPLVQGQSAPAQSVEQLRADFEKYSGTRLVFQAEDLPKGEYHDVMPALADEAKLRAARIALREVRKYPPGFLGAIGLKAIGIFQSCVSKQGDGFRPYDERLKGYRFYGIWNGKNAVAAAYYTDQQLPLTFHHEVFHHVDAVSQGKSIDRTVFSRDDRFREAVAGTNPYPAPKIAAEDLAALKKLGEGRFLEDAVSAYAKKSLGEDKAETARHFMTNLSDSLVQVVARPQIAGSQRILHVLHKYELALSGKGPGVAWFVDVALGRTLAKLQPPAPDNPYLKKVDAAIEDAAARAALRRVQPACVRINGASGVNLAPEGRILTASHVVNRLGAKTAVEFPDGRRFIATCVAYDGKLDLAICALTAEKRLPFAPVAKAAPASGTWVACIGQPGTSTPTGQPTGYQPFHVSTGSIRGYLDNPLGDQGLGRVKHDAWTYWGHSGSPLFNNKGQIVAMHNSWDSKTAMRHSVPHQAIVAFLDQETIRYTVGD